MDFHGISHVPFFFPLLETPKNLRDVRDSGGHDLMC